MNIKNLFLGFTLCSMLPLSIMAKNDNVKENVASFHNFTYTGNDDIYNQLTLPDESSCFNPIFPGWYSDPTICTNGEGDYFFATSSFSYYPGVPLYHSRDLLNWKQVGYILNRPSQLSHIKRQNLSGGIFAPALSYNPANKTYYMITTDVGSGNFLVKTTDPFGDWSDPIYLPEIKGIDPSIFFDTDGKAYIVNNDDAPAYRPEYPGHRTVRIMEFDWKNDKCVGQREIIVNKGVNFKEKPIWCEGPHIYKVNGEYYLMTAEGGTAYNHSEVIYKSKHPFGPYIPWKQNPILTQRDMPVDRENPVTCAGHADLVKTPSGDWYAIFLACRPLEGNYENLGRETFIMPVKWTTDGWPLVTLPKEGVPSIVNIKGAKRSDNVTFGNFSVNESFDSNKLSHDWMTLKGPASDLYSLTDKPGYLNIKCANVKSSEKTELPYICRRINHHKFEATTRLTFTPKNDDERAGMMLYKDETHHYFLAKEKAGKNSKLTLYKMTDNGLEKEQSVNIANKSTIDLKVASDGKTFDFYYSTNNGKTWKPVMLGADARYTSTANAGGFTGTTIGVYATGAKI